MTEEGEAGGRRAGLAASLGELFLLFFNYFCPFPLSLLLFVCLRQGPDSASMSLKGIWGKRYWRKVGTQ